MKITKIQTEDRQGKNNKAKAASETENRPTKLFKETLRSGQYLGSPGNLVIIGDVHQGAEVVAYGDILVLGSLQGIAHAGAEGDEKALIWALQFQPTQVRIADHITRPPDEEKKPGGIYPEVAFIKDGLVTIKAYPEGMLERRKFFEQIMEG